MSTKKGPTEEAQTIGERVREARRQAALTQEEVAERAEISPFSLSRIESGHNRPRWTTLRKLAKALDVDFYYLSAMPTEEWIAVGLGTTAKGSKEKMPPLPDEEGRPLEERTTYELLQGVTDLSHQLPSVLWRAKTALDGPERQEAEQAARNIFQRLTASFLEVQAREAIRLTVVDDAPDSVSEASLKKLPQDD